MTIIKDIAQNFDIDSLLQEYFLQFLDSAFAFLPMELIKKCYWPYQLPGLDATEAGDDYIEDQDPDVIERMLERAYIGFVAVAHVSTRSDADAEIAKNLDAIDALERAVDQGVVGDKLAMAYDCGRTRDAAEIAVYEERGGVAYERLLLTMRNIPFPKQRAVIAHLFERLPIKRGLFDKNGIGMELHEWAFKHFGPLKAEGADFNQVQKNDWAVTLKMQMESAKVWLLPCKDQQQQLHSVQKIPGTGGAFQFVVEDQTSTMGGGRKVHHHADKFWVNAMAVWLCHEMRGMVGRPAGTTTGQGGGAKEVRDQTATRGFRPAVGGKSIARTIAKKLNRG